MIPDLTPFYVTRVQQRRIYVASSWRNPFQPDVVKALRECGHEVYDFRNPTDGPAREGARGTGTGFQWSEIDPDWIGWDPEEFRRALAHPAAERGFMNDYKAMNEADTFVLVLPAGRSAHLELGWALGRHGVDFKECYVLLAPGEPELMYKIVESRGKLCVSMEELLLALARD